MTPLSDIEKLERLLSPVPETHAVFLNALPQLETEFELVARKLLPSLIADWKQMRETIDTCCNKDGGMSAKVARLEVEIERLTKELDEAYERAAQEADEGDAPTFIANRIRALKSKEPKP